MKKSILLVHLFCLLLLVGCDFKKKKEDAKPSPSTTETPEKSADKISLSYMPGIQKNIKINSSDNYQKKYVLREDENRFNIQDNLIRVVIPNADPNMKIVEVFNVSKYNDGLPLINAIVIHLSNGLETPTSETVTHKILADLEISKISGLSKKNLEDGKLKVYIINDKELDSAEKAAFLECARQETDYSHKKCNLDTGSLETLKEVLMPRVQEGDIITGG